MLYITRNVNSVATKAISVSFIEKYKKRVVHQRNYVKARIVEGSTFPKCLSGEALLRA